MSNAIPSAQPPPPVLVKCGSELAALIEQASHDLRSSLNAVKSWGYVLDRVMGEVTPSAQRALDGIHAGVQQQLALIEELEEAVRLLADDSPPSWQTVDLVEEAEAAIAARRPVAEGRGVPLPSAIAERNGTDFLMEGDVLRLQPLLRHLLGHCIWRATPGNAVAVHLRALPDALMLRVTEGPPLDATRGTERVGTLSEFFLRRAPVHGGPAMRQSAALLLTRRLAELHGAALCAEGIDGNVIGPTQARLPQPDFAGTAQLAVCISVTFPRRAQH